MKNLRKLGAAVVLTSVLALTAFAGEMQTPPCAAAQPGLTETPPYGGAPSDMGTAMGASTAPGDLGTTTLEKSFAQIAADVLLNILPLF